MSNEEIFEKQPTNVKQKYFLELGERMLNVDIIRVIEKYEEYDYENMEYVYGITINPDETGKVMDSNLIELFDSKKIRDKNYNVLKNKLEEFGVIFL